MAVLDETAAATSREAAACGGLTSPAWGEEAGGGPEGIPGMAEDVYKRQVDLVV